MRHSLSHRIVDVLALTASLRPLRLFAAILPLLALTACGPRETAVERGDREQILHRGIGSDIADLDPHLAVNIAEMDIVSALFEGLVVEDPTDLRATPGVAERWDVSPDALTYTFHLRPNARWSDETPVTAADFLAAWQRALTPSLAADNASLLYVLQGAEAFHKGIAKDFAQVGAAALDERTLRLTLERPTAHFLSLLTHPIWLPVKLAAVAAHGPTHERGNPWTRPGRLVGNGPFILESWQPNQFVAVAKSPTYWDAARVRLNGIRFYPVDSRDAEERMFRSNQLHLTYVLPAAKTESYRRNQPQLLRTDPYLNTYFLRLNLRHPSLADARVRRALSLAIDRPAITEKILRGGQRPASTLTPPDLPGYAPPESPATDPTEARRLLADAGFASGKGFPPIEFLYNTSENHRLLAEALQEMWRRELGIDVRLVNQELKVVQAERRAGRYQIVLSDWVGDYLDPLTFLDIMRSDSG
ncbi:MAG TPA: peptide ABC transporter substrate-binding protein, partial [Opitutus sp.]|nr:peptide ABC transporter substrate-binding protein [Opitutus sp.]